MNFDWETFQEAYKNADYRIRGLVDNGRGGDIARQLTETFTIRSTYTRDVVLIVNWRLLGILPDESLQTVLNDIHIEKHRQSDFITHLNAFILELTADKSVNPENIPRVSAPITAEAASKETIPPVRTMARDMHDLQSQHPEEIVHTSSQETTRPVTNSTEEEAVASPTSPFTEATSPAPSAPVTRWDSEQA